MDNQKKIKDLKIILTGGGTGGHVIPCLAIYRIIKEKFGVKDALYLGIKGKAEESIVPKHNLKLEFIKSAPISGTGKAEKIKSVFKIIGGTLQSCLKIIKFKPDIVIASGGYVSAPVVFASFLLQPFLKHKIVLDEQNLVPGLLNKAASLFADIVFVNFRESAYFIWSNSCVYTGYPVRKEYVEEYSQKEIKAKLNIPEGKKLILITGGSLGARTINNLIAETLPSLAESKDLFIVHSIGLNNSKNYNAFEDTLNLLNKTGLKVERENNVINVYGKNGLFYRGYSFIHNIFDYQKAADLIVSRAGAGAISEILALKKPSILIPKRGLPGDHQELNAIGIAEKGGCEVIFERKKDGKDYIDREEFVRLLTALINDKEKAEKMRLSAEKIFFRKFENIIGETIEKLMTGKKEDINFIAGVLEPPFVKFQRYFDNLVNYLDSLQKQGKTDNLYAKFYRIKVDEFWESENFMVKNKAIKLIGALRLTEKYHSLAENFDNFKGYLKRNTLIAFKKSPRFYPYFVEIVKKGLDDPYFEVRREAISLFIAFYENFRENGDIKKAILEKLEKRFESFEVKCESIKASALILTENEFIKTNKRFLTHKNVRIREALLDAVSMGINRSTFKDIQTLTVFLKKMLITTSEFKPVYSVREKYFNTLRILEGRND